MALIRVQVEREIAVPLERVRRCIADFKRHRPNWLPPAYSGLTVEKGGTGAGTVVRYTLKVGPRQREYRMQIAEPKPGRVLTEQDAGSSLQNTWTLAPRGDGCTVTLATQWQGAGGVGGIFERLFAPRGLRRLYEDELARLANYATTIR